MSRSNFLSIVWSLLRCAWLTVRLTLWDLPQVIYKVFRAIWSWYKRRVLIPNQCYGLVPAVQQALRKLFFDQERLAKLDWSGLDPNASIEAINKVLVALQDPFTRLENAKQVKATDAMRRSTMKVISFGKVCYLKPGDFNAPGFESKILTVFAHQVKGKRRLILDLRNNLGGTTGSALLIAALLMPRRPTILCTISQPLGGDTPFTVAIMSQVQGWTGRQVVSSLFLDSEPIQLRTRKCKARKPHVVVLVNARTASAAELLAAAIRDHGRGTIVGTTTLGKGVGQERVILRDKDGQPIHLWITTGKTFTPAGHWLGDGNNDRHGLVPDHVIKQTKGAAGDPQLEFAVQLLRQRK